MSDNDTPAVPVAPEGEATPAQESPVQNQPSAFEELAQKKGFKGPDDLAKAYQELESHNKKTEMARADLEKLFFAAPQESAKETSQPPQSESADLDRFVQERLAKTEAQLKAEMDDKLQRLELKSLLKEHEDFGQYAKDIKELRTKHPTMGFEEAYTFAKAQSGNLAKEARSQAQQSVQIARQAQSQAQVTPAKSGAEHKVSPSDILAGAGTRWAPPARGQADARAVAEIEQVERELFGHVLQKTNSGL